MPAPYWLFAGALLALALTPAVLTDKGPSTMRSFAVRTVAAVAVVAWSLALAWGTLDHVLLWTIFAVTSVISVWVDAYASSPLLWTLRRSPQSSSDRR